MNASYRTSSASRTSLHIRELMEAEVQREAIFKTKTTSIKTHSSSRNQNLTTPKQSRKQVINLFAQAQTMQHGTKTKDKLQLQQCMLPRKPKRVSLHEVDSEKHRRSDLKLVKRKITVALQRDILDRMVRLAEKGIKHRIFCALKDA